MNTPILLALVTLVTLGIVAFFDKVAGANQVYIPSWLIVNSIPYALLGIVVHLIQRHPFDLSPRMTWLAVVSGFIGAIGIFSLLLAFKAGGQGSIILPISGLGVVVAVILSYIVYHEPITMTKLLGLGLGVSSIIVLSR